MSNSKLKNPNAKENLIPFTSDTAREAILMRWERKKRIGEKSTDDTPGKTDDNGKPTAKFVPMQFNAAELDEAYVAKAFPGFWRKQYYQMYRRLRSQYAPKGSKSYQYSILVQRAAALHTKIMIEEAKSEKEREPYLILRMENVLKDWIAQLQKYTEAERREVYVQQEIVVTTLSKVVSIGEATILDTAQRAAFMRGLASMISDTPDTGLKQLTGPDVIDLVANEP